MSLGIIGRKIGMTRVFQEDGTSVPVTVIEAQPNRVTQLKTVDTDGYSAIQVAFGEKKASRLNKPELGSFAKAEVEPGHTLFEFRLTQDQMSDMTPGSEIAVTIFNEGDMVDVIGNSIGKGFAGVMKRHGFKGGRATHGNSKAHRKPGSIGQNQDPGRVFKGKKMAGHMGDVQRTQQKLTVVTVDQERNLLFIKGSVPGSKGQNVVVIPTVKAKTAKHSG